MNLYSKLSKVGILKSYSSKFLAVAFLGIHVPLIGLIIFILLNDGALSTSFIIILTLLLTLGATAVTLFVLNKLLEPLKLARKSLKDYLENQKIPELPLHYKDEIGELLKDLQFSIKVFDQLIELKQNTIEVLSHDLKSPCITLNSLADMLQKKKDPKEREQIIEHIKTTSQEQLTLITNILTNLRSESKTRGELTKEKLNIKEIIKEVILSKKLDSAAKNIDIKFNYDEDIFYTGNETAMRQVFSNLIGNAIKFSKENSEINVKIDWNNTDLSISIIDEGIGFISKKSKALFKPFTKYSRKGTNNEPSEGMGLFISRRFINKHSGTLEAKSEGPNKGSNFTIKLPLN